MCWIGKLELKTAEKDIPIFKVMYTRKEKLYSLYRYYEYILNKEIESPIFPDPVFNNDYCVSVALHSYDEQSVVIIKFLHSIKIKVKKDYFYLDTIRFSPNIVKVKGIIPKGATYCMNSRGEYISDKLILKEITNEIQTIAANI